MLKVIEGFVQLMLGLKVLKLIEGFVMQRFCDVGLKDAYAGLRDT